MRPYPRVQLGFPANPSSDFLILDDPERGLLDQGLLAPDSGPFVDVTDRLDGNARFPIEINRGRAGPNSDYETGRCTLRLSYHDGALDPLNLTGPYVTGGATLVEPGRVCWVTMEYGANPGDDPDDRFYGFIDSYTPDLSIIGWPVMVIECTGLFPVLADVDPDAIDPVGGGELSGARMHRLCDAAQIRDGDRDFAAGDFTLQATTMAQNILTECRLTAASEHGAFYEDRHGKLKFDNRSAILNVIRSTIPQATFGPAGNEDDDILPYVDLVPAYDKELVVNRASIANVGGTAQQAEDLGSQAKYQLHTVKRTDLLLQSNTDAATLAALEVLLNSKATYRYPSVTVDAYACPDEHLDAMFTALRGRELRDRIAVLEQVTYDDDGVPWVRENLAEVFVEHLKESIGNPAEDAWTVEFGLSDAGAFEHLFRFDDSLLDGTDVLAPL